MTGPGDDCVLPPSAFPYTVQLVDPVTSEVLWSQTIRGPGRVCFPGPDELGCRRAVARIMFNDGTAADVPVVAG